MNARCVCLVCVMSHQHLCLGVQAVKKEVDDAVERAKKGTIPPSEMLWKNIYADPLGSVMRGLDSSTKIQLT